MSFVFGVIVGFLLAVLFGIAIVARDMDTKG